MKNRPTKYIIAMHQSI